MKLEGILPVPTMTATMLPAVGKHPRQVVVHGTPGWKRALGHPDAMRVHHCTTCGKANHNRRRCPAKGLP